jgi:hypothetical protein
MLIALESFTSLLDEELIEESDNETKPRRNDNTSLCNLLSPRPTTTIMRIIVR